MVQAGNEVRIIATGEVRTCLGVRRYDKNTLCLSGKPLLIVSATEVEVASKRIGLSMQQRWYRQDVYGDSWVDA